MSVCGGGGGAGMHGRCGLYVSVCACVAAAV